MQTYQDRALLQEAPGGFNLISLRALHYINDGLLRSREEAETLAVALNVEVIVPKPCPPPVRILSVRVNQDNPARATVITTGITAANYAVNRIFTHEGRRWVLQGSFGWGQGEIYFFAEQHD